MVIFQYNLFIFGIYLWTLLYPNSCYNEPCYKEVVVYIKYHNYPLHEKMHLLTCGTNQVSDRSDLGPVVQSIVSLTSSLRVILLTVLADSIYNVQYSDIFCWKNVSSYSHFFSKKFQHICVSLDVNFNESLTNNIVSFEQLGPDHQAVFRRLQVVKWTFSSVRTSMIRS